MKFLILFFFFPFSLCAQSSIYDLNIETIKDNSLSLSSFKNKKIVIAAMDMENPNTGLLSYLDSLQKGTERNLSVIVIPIKENVKSINVATLKQINATLAPTLNICKPVLSKKTSGANQHPLFKWLTNVSNNQHFNYDVENGEQIFVINEKGSLYAVLKKGVSKELLTRVVDRKF